MRSWLRTAALGALLVGCRASAAGDEHAGHGSPPATATAAPADAHAAHAPSGYAPATISSSAARAMGLATVKLETRSLGKSVDTVGVLALDETRTAHVHAKVRGVVEGVSVDFIGKAVRRGQPLCAIYSQSVLAAQLELIAVVKQRRQAAASKELAGVGDLGWDGIVDGARRRLMLWDVPKSQIERLERDLSPTRTFTLAAPRAGVVLARQAYVGSYVEPGTELYVISDTSHLWAVIDLRDADARHVRVGTPLKLVVEGRAEPLTSIVDFLPPTIDEGTRTLKARASIHNPSGDLRPGSFLSATFALSLEDGLVVPEDAVIRTGKRNIVFVVHGEQVMPREVELGPQVDGGFRVEAGLSEGESVAVGAQFLLDSDSRLRATSKPGGAHAGH